MVSYKPWPSPRLHDYNLVKLSSAIDWLEDCYRLWARLNLNIKTEILQLSLRILPNDPIFYISNCASLSHGGIYNSEQSGWVHGVENGLYLGTGVLIKV